MLRSNLTPGSRFHGSPRSGPLDSQPRKLEVVSKVSALEEDTRPLDYACEMWLRSCSCKASDLASSISSKRSWPGKSASAIFGKGHRREAACGLRPKGVLVSVESAPKSGEVRARSLKRRRKAALLGSDSFWSSKIRRVHLSKGVCTSVTVAVIAWASVGMASCQGFCLRGVLEAPLCAPSTSQSSQSLQSAIKQLASSPLIGRGYQVLNQAHTLGRSRQGSCGRAPGMKSCVASSAVQTSQDSKVAEYNESMKRAMANPYEYHHDLGELFCCS